MDGETIDQQLVQPYFIPMAKAGNYPEGVKSLLKQINSRIIARDRPESPPTAISQSTPVTITPPAATTQLATPTVTDTTEIQQATHESQPSFLRHAVTSPTYIAGTGIALGLMTLMILRILHLRA